MYSGLFEHDDDIVHAVKVSKVIAQGDSRQFVHLVVHTLSDCPDEVKVFYLQEYNCSEKPSQDGEEVSMNTLIRKKLDSGLGDELLAKQRLLKGEQDILGDLKLRTIVLAAVMMRHGARIKDDDRRYLRELVPKIHCAARLSSIPASAAPERDSSSLLWITTSLTSPGPSRSRAATTAAGSMTISRARARFSGSVADAAKKWLLLGSVTRSVPSL